MGAEIDRSRDLEISTVTYGALGSVVEVVQPSFLGVADLVLRREHRKRIRVHHGLGLERRRAEQVLAFLRFSEIDVERGTRQPPTNPNHSSARARSLATTNSFGLLALLFAVEVRQVEGTDDRLTCGAARATRRRSFVSEWRWGRSRG